MVSKFLKFLTESKKRSKRLGEKYVLNNIPLIVKDPFVIDISVETVFDRVSKLVPTKFFSFIDAIYVGDFDIMREREINAMYKAAEYRNYSSKYHFQNKKSKILRQVDSIFLLYLLL